MIAEQVHPTLDAVKQPLNRLAMCRLITHIYNCGYKAGHQDTVEGCYTDILEQDMDTYQDDIVKTVLNEFRSA